MTFRVVITLLALGTFGLGSTSTLLAKDAHHPSPFGILENRGNIPREEKIKKQKKKLLHKQKKMEDYIVGKPGDSCGGA